MGRGSTTRCKLGIYNYIDCSDNAKGISHAFRVIYLNHGVIQWRDKGARERVTQKWLSRPKTMANVDQTLATSDEVNSFLIASFVDQDVYCLYDMMYDG